MVVRCLSTIQALAKVNTPKLADVSLFDFMALFSSFIKASVPLLTGESSCTALSCLSVPRVIIY